MTSVASKLVAAFFVTVIVSVVPSSASSYEAVTGEYWTYAISMDCRGYDVEGEYTVAFEERETVELDGLAHDVNVFSVSGTFAGEDKLLSVPVAVEGGLRGTVLEPSEGFGLLKEDTTVWFNLTYDFGFEETTVRGETHTIYTATPAWFNSFHPGETKLSDHWTENITETTACIEYEYGVELARETETGTVAYSFTVSGTEDLVTTPAGEFLAMVITVYCEDGSTDSYWWSDDVGNFVLEMHYSPDDMQPYLSSELIDFENKVQKSTVIFVIVGVAGVVVAIAVLFFVLVRVKGPAPPQPPVEGPERPFPPATPSH